MRRGRMLEARDRAGAASPHRAPAEDDRLALPFFEAAAACPDASVRASWRRARAAAAHGRRPPARPVAYAVLTSS